MTVLALCYNLQPLTFVGVVDPADDAEHVYQLISTQLQLEINRSESKSKQCERYLLGRPLCPGCLVTVR